MVAPILMPALSPTMKEGTLAKWLKKEGDSVESGEVIAEIETDKATMEVEAVDSGIIAKIIIDSGTTKVSVNSLIAVIKEDDDEDSAVEEVINSHANASSVVAEEVKVEKSVKEEVKNTSKPEQSKSEGRVFISPLAKRIANQNNLNYTGISGSGPKGRIVKADVENALESGGSPTKHISPMGFARCPQEYTATPATPIRQVIAERLVESKQQIPHFYLTVEVDVDALLKSRAEINSKAPMNSEGKPEYKISVNDIIVKAVAIAMGRVPEVNSYWDNGNINRLHNVDVAVAVATPTGLITPILRNADQKSLSYISREVKELAGKAKEGSLAPEEYQGGGFTISNLGMYGITEFKAIINPPQSAILAVGATQERVVMNNGNPVGKQFMTLSLSCDHRVVDGAVAAVFMGELKNLLSNPVMMLV